MGMFSGFLSSAGASGNDIDLTQIPRVERADDFAEVQAIKRKLAALDGRAAEINSRRAELANLFASKEANRAAVAEAGRSLWDAAELPAIETPAGPSKTEMAAEDGHLAGRILLVEEALRIGQEELRRARSSAGKQAIDPLRSWHREMAREMLRSLRIVASGNISLRRLDDAIRAAGHTQELPRVAFGDLHAPLAADSRLARFASELLRLELIDESRDQAMLEGTGLSRAEGVERGRANAELSERTYYPPPAGARQESGHHLPPGWEQLGLS